MPDPSNLAGAPVRGLQDIVDRFTAAGMSEEDTRVFVHLATQGPRRASTVARALQMSRAQVYRVLSRLEDRDFVQVTGDHPGVYIAAPLKRVVDELVRENRSRLEGLQRLRYDLPPSLQAAEDEERPPPAARRIKGRPRVYNMMETMLRKGRRSVDVAFLHPRAHSLAVRMGVWARVLERAGEGLCVRALVPDRPQPAAVVLPGKGGMEIREAPHGPPHQCLVVDGRETLLWIVHGRTDRLADPDEVAVWTDDPEFARRESHAFRLRWDEATPAEAARVS